MGFCRCDSVETIEGYRDMVDQGKLCYGSEATCVAIAPYAQSDHYTPVPLVLSPSDKTEKGEELKAWIQDLLDSWEKHEHGAASHGPSRGAHTFPTQARGIANVPGASINP